MRHKIAALVVLLLVLTLVGVLAQSNFGQVHGIVWDLRGDRMPGATVTLSRPGHAGRETLTNKRGEFSFRFVEPGLYSITASFIGFVSPTFEREVARNATVEVSLGLQISTPAEKPESCADCGGVGKSADVNSALRGGVVGGVAGGVVGGVAGGVAAGAGGGIASSGAPIRLGGPPRSTPSVTTASPTTNGSGLRSSRCRRSRPTWTRRRTRMCAASSGTARRRRRMPSASRS